MKNPHGVEPTRYMKREESKYAIEWYSIWGPTFSGNGWFDILIGNNCNKESNSIDNDGTNGYECHPEYKKSLFVNSNKPDEANYFAVLDYEVFTHD